jgi:hypothetical protein
MASLKEQGIDIEQRFDLGFGDLERCPQEINGE